MVPQLPASAPAEHVWVNLLDKDLLLPLHAYGLILHCRHWSRIHAHLIISAINPASPGARCPPRIRSLKH